MKRNLMTMRKNLLLLRRLPRGRLFHALLRGAPRNYGPLLFFRRRSWDQVSRGLGFSSSKGFLILVILKLINVAATNLKSVYILLRILRHKPLLLVRSVLLDTANTRFV